MAENSRTKTQLRSNLSRVRGLGSTREGVHHWWAQRLSAVALIPLSMWFIYSLIALTGADYYLFKEWASEFGNTVFLILFIATLFHHAQLGVTVVIEDYIHSEPVKMAMVLLVKYGTMLFAASSVFAVLKISIAGG